MSKAYAEANAKKKKKNQETAQKVAQSPSVSERRKISEDNMNLKQTKIRQNSERSRVETRKLSSTNRRYSTSAAQRQKMGMPTESDLRLARKEREQKARQRLDNAQRQQRIKSGIETEDDRKAIREQHDTAKRAIRNTPGLAKKAVKDTIGSHAQTIADITEMTASNKNGTDALAMKMGIDKDDVVQRAKLEGQRQKTVKKAKEDRLKFAEAQDKRQKEWDEKTKGAKGLEKAYYGAVESGVGVATDLVIGLGTQGGALAAMGSRTYGQTRGQAEKEGATENEDRVYALMQAGKEVATELMFPGVGLAKGYAGKVGLPLAERVANRLTKNIANRTAADIAGAGTRLLGGTVEENLEEIAGWGADPLIKEIAYGRSLRTRQAQNVLQQESDALRANLQSEDDARYAAAYLSSDSFIEQNKKQYMDAGLSEKQAEEVAIKMRDYLTASLTGDTKTMEALEDEIVSTIAGKTFSRKDWDLGELKDTIASTSLLTLTTGLPPGVSTAVRGSMIRDELGDEGVRALANTAIDFEDSEASLRAEVAKERLDSGKELTVTQVYDLAVAQDQQVAKDINRVASKNSMAAREIKEQDLVTPKLVRNEDGSIMGDEVIAREYVSSSESAAETIRAYDSEDTNSLTPEEVDTGARAIAGFKTGAFTVNDANALNYSNTAVRAAFVEETGIDLNQYIVKKSDGSVDIPATNTRTKDALFAMAADNLVKSAQAETLNWMDKAKGETVSQITQRMDSQGALDLQKVLDDVDERDRSTYLMVANAADMAYQAGRNIGTEWDEIKNSIVATYPGVSETKLQAMYEAGRTDRKKAADKAATRSVQRGQSMSKMGDQENPMGGQVFYDRENPPKGSVIRTFSEIAANLGVNIHLVSEIYDQNGNVVKRANGQHFYGEIYINVETAIEKNIGFIFMHEFTHHLKKFAPEEYLQLENLVREKWFKKDPSQMQDAIQQKIEEYKSVGTLTEEMALEEIIADSAHEFLNDENFVREVAEENPTLAQAIINSIKNVLRKLRQLLAEGEFTDETHMASLFSELDIMAEAEELWLNAAKAAKKVRANQAIDDWDAQARMTVEEQTEALSNEIESERYSIVEDKDLIRRLDADSHINTYRAMALINGKLYPPMATKVKDEKGKWQLQQGMDIGQWIESDITTDSRMFDKDGKFHLKKDDGSDVYAAYNPYIHSSDSMLNDQFATAYKRPNIVVVEGEIPESELTSGYRAEHDLDDGRHVVAKDTTGITDWKAGVVQGQLSGKRTVYLTQHFKPVRIVPDTEVAEHIRDKVAGTDIAIPYNVVTPSVRDELLNLGVKMEQSKEEKYYVEGAAQVRFSISDADYMDAVENGETKAAQKMVDRAAKDAGFAVKGYHGTTADFKSFKPGDIGIHFGKNKSTARTRVGRGKNTKIIPAWIALNNPIQIDVDFGSWDADYRLADYLRDEGVITPEEHQDALTVDNGSRRVKRSTKSANAALRDILKSKGYDGIEYINYYEADGATSYIVFDSEQVKSAEPVTYDDEGVVIPLSERFNEETPDLRYSFSDDQLETLENEAGPNIRFSKTTEFDVLPKAAYTTNAGYSGYVMNASGRQLRLDLNKANFSEAQANAVDKFMKLMADWFDETGEGSLQYKYRFIGWQDLTDATVQVKRNDAGEIVGVTVSAMVKNGEYPVNFDLTTVCNKREGVTDVIKNLMNTKVPGTNESVLNSIKLSDQNMWKINQALKAEGIDTACLGCFVEARRYYAQNFMDKIDDKWNSAVRKARRQLGLPENEYFNFAHGRAVTGEEWSSIDSLWTKYEESTESKSSPADRIKILMDEIVRNKEVDSPYLKLIQMSDILTPEGINGFKQLSNKGHDMVKTIKSIYGTSAPKEILAFTPYNSEIALLPDQMKGMETPDYLRSIGGIRVQSFSDFKIEHVYEHFQMVADEAARKFVTHGYSKVIAFPRIFGLTGRKINMSVMFDVLPNKAWSQALGIPVRKARKYAKMYQGLQFVKEKPTNNVDNRPYKEVEIEGVHGYLTYLISDADYVNSVYDRLYQENINAGMSEAQARRKANESKPFEQSINYREAVELENRDGYKENVGIIAVAYGDEHLKMLLADPNVRYIIPYHKSGLPTFISKKTSLAIARDYTNFQNTNIAETWKDANGKVIDLNKEYKKFLKENSGEKYPAIKFFKQINDSNYTVKFGSKDSSQKAAMAGTADFDVYKDLDKVSEIQEVANAYLEHCIKNGWCPIFHEFAGDPNYYKMLFDFAVTDQDGNIYPQKVVRNVYPGIDIDAKVSAGEEITADDLAELKEAVEQGADEQNRKNMIRAQNMPNVMNDLLSRSTENSIIADTNIQSIQYNTPDYTNVKYGNPAMTPQETDDDRRLSISEDIDDAYMDAVKAEDMEEAQRLVDEAAKRAGFYFSTEEDDSVNHYADVEGADNYFKWSSLAEHIWEQINDGEWEGPEFESYEDVVEFAKNELNKDPGTYDVYLNYKKPYVRDFKNSTNIYEDIIEDFDESVVNRDDFDDEDDYEDALYEAKIEHVYEAIDSAVIGANSDLENNYEVIYGPQLSEIVSSIAEHAVEWESLTWDDINDALYQLGETMVTNYNWTEDADATPEIARAIIENFGFDAIEDKEVSSKFGQLSREMMADTEHIIVFKPEQIKLSDPVTYAEDGSVIPLSERFDPDNNDIRYSLPTQDSDGNILSDGQMEFFKNSQARDEQGRLVPVYHATPNGGFTIFDPTYSFDNTSISFTNDLDLALNYAAEEDDIESQMEAADTRLGDGEAEGLGHYKVYLNMENPLVVDGSGIVFNDEVYDLTYRAKDEGYDGLIMRNFQDLDADIYQVFSGNQVKDTRNTDPSENPDIRFSLPSEDDIVAYALERANSTDELWYSDPVLEEGRIRYSLTKDDFINSKSEYWNPAWLTEGYVLEEKSVKDSIRNVIKGAMMNSDTTAQYRTELVDKAMKVAKRAYKAMKRGDHSMAASMLFETAYDMIHDVEFFMDDSMFDTYMELRDYFKATKIFVPKQYRSDMEYNSFRKRNMGRILLRNDGVAVDEVWQQLNEKWPEWFSDDIEHPAEMMLQIEHVLDAAKPMAVAYSSEEAMDFAGDIASDLYDIIYEGKEFKSLADKYDEKTKALKARHQEAMQKMRQSLEDERERRREAVASLKAENKRNLKTQKKKYEFEIAELKQNREYNIQRLLTEKNREVAEARKEGREQRDAAVAAEKQKRKDEREKRKARESHRKQFNRIRDNYDWFATRLVSPTKDKNIPEQLRVPLAKLLMQLDLQTERSKALEEKYGVAKSTLQMRELKDKLSNVAKEDDSGDLPYNSWLADTMEWLADQIDDEPIDSLTTTEIEYLNTVLTTIKYGIENHRKVRINGKLEEIASYGDKMIATLKERIAKFGQRKEFNKGTLRKLDTLVNEGEETPPYFFERLDPKKTGLGAMYRELRKGEDKHIRNMNYLRKKFKEITGKYANNKKPGSSLEDWRSLKYAVTVELSSGPITLTQAQLMSLYCLSKRPEALDHILVGGISIMPVSFGAKMRSAHKTSSTKISYEELLELITKLTPEQKSIADKLQSLMANEMAAWGNETSMEMYGIKMFRDPAYFPMRSSQMELATDVNNPQKSTAEKIRNFGFTKPLTPNANNAIYIDDIFSVVADHCNKMSLYNALAVPIMDFMKVYNYKQRNDDGSTVTVKETIGDAFTSKANAYIEKFLADVNGNTKSKSDAVDDLFKKALANYKKASIGANMRVALQQPTAIFRSFMVLDPKYFVGIKPISVKDAREMFEHCPIALWKSWGHYDMDMGHDIEDIMMNKDWKRTDIVTMGLYGLLDNWAWSMIWQAVKNEVKSTHKGIDENSPEFFELCNERASEVFDKTQVVDSIFHRSDTMRSKNTITKMATSFMAEPTLTYNVFRDSLVRIIDMLRQHNYEEAGKIFAKMALVLGLNAAAVSASAAIWDAVRGKGDDDDDPKSKYQLWLDNFKANFLDNAPWAQWNNIYFIKDLADLAKNAEKGFGTSNMALEGFETLFKGITQLKKKANGGAPKTKWIDIFTNLLGGIGYVFGFPAKTVMRDLVKPLFEYMGVSALSELEEGEDPKLIPGGFADNFTKLFTGDNGGSEGGTSSEDEDAGSDVADTLKLGKKAVKTVAKTTLKKREKTEVELLADIKEKTIGYSGADRDKRIWDIVSDGYTEHVEQGDYAYVDKMRRVVQAAGGDLNSFDKKIFEASKTAMKKTIISDPTQAQIEQQDRIKDYLLNHGMTVDEISSEICYKSNTARDLKAAMRMNNVDYMVEELVPLLRAGMTRDDIYKLYKYRNMGAKTYDGKYSDPKYKQSTGKYQWPITGQITSQFGEVSSIRNGRTHAGLDIAGNMGDPISAADGGTVVYVGWYGGGGNTVMIQHDDGTITEYMHMSAFNCKEGDTVSQGQTIGAVGSTGNSTGPHCHFGVKVNGEHVDPLTYLNG